MAKYYWLKLHKDFFKRHDVSIIEDMPNGKDYILFYLKLLVESVSHEGNLRFSDSIPYNEQMLSSLTKTNIDIVRSAVKIFSELNMMEMLDDGTIYMTEVDKMIGAETDAHIREQTRLRVAKYRERQKSLRNDTVTLNGNVEIRDKSIEIDNNIISNDIICQTQSVRRVVEEWNTLSVFGISQVAKIDSNSKRYKSLVARLNQYGEEQVLKAIDNIRHSDFLQGKHDGKHWQITFDWFVLPNNFPKVLEGNYDNINNNNSNGQKFNSTSNYESATDKRRREQQEYASRLANELQQKYGSC
jgi:predicted phage replisome organizer